MNKTAKNSIEDLLRLENEFKTYLRPVIEDEKHGWQFLAANLKSEGDAMYPKIFNFRQQERSR
jgi:hypothetical protein